MMMATAMSTTAVAQNRVKNIYASTPKLDMELMQKSDQTVQLNRYFFAGYNTLCLPFSLTGDQMAAAAKDLKIERLAGIQQEGQTLNLYFVDCTADGIQAGVPYLIYSPTAQYLRVKNSEALNFDNELKAVRMSDNNGNTITFGSAWESIEKVGRYGIPAKQDVTPLQAILVRTNADKTFLPTRCGFSWDQQAPSATDLQIIHATSMAEVTAITTATQRKVNKNTKGLRIQDGKKVVK